ncbi:hypothetical protein J6590_076447 [Homalodisca vitripennis]|nr:hypothetical protein J6590_076447 [Homalodisca vitripennis]
MHTNPGLLPGLRWTREMFHIKHAEIDAGFDCRCKRHQRVSIDDSRVYEDCRGHVVDIVLFVIKHLGHRSVGLDLGRGREELVAWAEGISPLSVQRRPSGRGHLASDNGEIADIFIKDSFCRNGSVMSFTFQGRLVVCGFGTAENSSWSMKSLSSQRVSLVQRITNHHSSNKECKYIFVVLNIISTPSEELGTGTEHGSQFYERR